MIQPHAFTAGGCIWTRLGRRLLLPPSSARALCDLLPRGPARWNNVGGGWRLACRSAPRRAVILPPVFLHWLALGVPSVVLRCGGWGRAEVVIPRRPRPSAQAQAGCVPGSGSFGCFLAILLLWVQGHAGCGLGSRVHDLQNLAHPGLLGTRVEARLPEAAQRGVLGPRPRLEALRQERADVSLGTDMKMGAGSSYYAEI